MSNDPSLSSLPLLSTFLKSYSLPFLGIVPPQATSKQVSASAEPGNLSEETTKEANGAFPTTSKEDDELVEKDIRDRFKKMCEGYFENVSKKLVIEHNVRFRSLVEYNDVRVETDPIRRSASKNKTARITKHTFALEKYSRIGNKPMRR